MRSATIQKILAVSTLGLVLTIGAAIPVSAQGKGHGGGKGNGGGHGQQGPPRAGNLGPPRQERHAGPQARPGFGQAPVIRQQAQAFPQNGKGHGNGRGRMEQPRPQPQPRGQQAPRVDFRIMQQAQDDKGKRGHRAGFGDRYPAPGLLGPPIRDPKWQGNYGQNRSAEVHIRNAERKAIREQAKIWRGYPDDRNFRRMNNDRRQSAWRERYRDETLRSLVVNVLATSNGTWAEPYYRTSNNIAPYYYSAYDPGSYYSVYPRYPAYVETVSYYNFYTPANYSYYSYEDPYYADYYAYDPESAYVPASSSAGGFLTRLFSELVAYGYNQGFRDAQYARAHNRRARYTYDPYDPYVYVDDEDIYEDVGYDPYSCVGENRRYVSDGYELGYRDALAGRTPYDPYEGSGNIDLVSVLITTAL